MIDINAPEPAASTPLAKAHPAQDLLGKPGWICPHCNHKNPVTAPFCEKCEK